MDKESAFKKWIGEFHYEEDVQDAFFNGFELGQSCAFEWQPVEIAPSNARILIFSSFGGVVSIACKRNGNWFSDSGNWAISHPSHWMPLPTPPEELEKLE